MLTVRDLMTQKPDTVAPDNSLRVALAKMNNDGCRQLPVVENGILVGILTDRDVRLALDAPVVRGEHEMARAELLDQLTVAGSMTPDPLSASAAASAREVADKMRLHKFGALPVVDDGALVGIITTSDFLEYFSARAED